MEAQADELAAPDRDRLLAVVYQRTYGKKVDSTGICTVCFSTYDLSFSLDDLTAAVDRSSASPAAQALPDGTFRTADGWRFRLPVGRDEIEVSMLLPEEAARTLASRCVVESSAGDALAVLEAAMEEVAPVLDLDIDTACPECGARQVVRFDIQFYLLRAIQQEHAQVSREIHRIASSYGWSLEDILTLECTERRRLVQLIEADIPARRSRQ
jgi:hypothetical protein